MKKLIIFTTILLIFPLIVNANIICNDGTISPTCIDCHQGCCSKHGGCSNNNNTVHNNNSNTNYNKNTESNSQKYSETQKTQLNNDINECTEKDNLISEQKESINNLKFDIKNLNNNIDTLEEKQNELTLKVKEANNKKKKIKNELKVYQTLTIILFCYSFIVSIIIIRNKLNKEQ